MGIESVEGESLESHTEVYISMERIRSLGLRQIKLNEEWNTEETNINEFNDFYEGILHIIEFNEDKLILLDSSSAGDNYFSRIFYADSFRNSVRRDGSMILRNSREGTWVTLDPDDHVNIRKAETERPSMFDESEGK